MDQQSLTLVNPNAKLFDINKSGWMHDIMGDLNANKPICLAFSGQSLIDLVSKAKDNESKVIQVLSSFNTLSSSNPIAVIGNVAPTFLGNFVALGSVGGMLGCLGVVACIAHHKNMKIAICFIVPPNILDYTKGQLNIEIF